ncbi:MAG: hypothetical protein HOP15_14420 [Planctomycetes bacterium]|nr:hypothetical protein [Planctomycetota bacterium]
MRLPVHATLAALWLTLPALAQVQLDARPAPGTPAPVDPPRTGVTLPQRFVAIGDFGTTSPESFEVAALVRSLRPRFVLTLGDNNYPSGAASTIDQNIGQHYHEFIRPYLGSYGAGASHNRFFPCLGNHDWGTTDAQPYLDYFELPGNERYYDFRRGAVHFFVLDSDPAEPDGITRDSLQAQWLESRLRASTAPFKMVTLHHPPYSSSSNHGSTGALQWPLKEWGASIVLAGHDHTYERLTVSGLPYIVNGLGGRNVYAFGDPLAGTELRFNAEHGALLVEADEHFARFRFLTSSDTVQDDFLLPSGGIDPGSVTFVAEDTLWKYLDSGVDPGPSWKARGFDDSGWASGPAQLGYGEGDEATLVSYGPSTSNRYVTTWFRRGFTVAEPQELDSLQLRLVLDDGAVVYLNGVEVLRAGMPAGVIGATTLAASSVSGEAENTFVAHSFGTETLLVLQPGQLSRGYNMLAVEVHQASRSSNDVSFAAELVGLPRGALLLARGSTWRYRDSGVAPAATWKDPGFDDSSWSAGRAQLGYGEGDQATTIASGSTTAWFRTTFTVADTAALRFLWCRLLRDDGALVYLNGKEAQRLNLPRTGVTPATFAPFNFGQEVEGRFEGTSLDPRLLVNGQNTLAVEIHQSNQANPDLSFDLELVGH